jgi:hypothetical protein
MFSFPKWDSGLVARGPPSPWSAGIIDLGGISKLILEAQSLRGKILVSKNLVAAIEEPSPKTDALPPAHRHDLDDDRANAPVNARLDVTSRCEQEHNLRPRIPSWTDGESRRVPSRPGALTRRVNRIKGPKAITTKDTKVHEGIFQGFPS